MPQTQVTITLTYESGLTEAAIAQQWREQIQEGAYDDIEVDVIQQ